ncbi:MAG: O-succinylhomoserine sulfhydrylase [Alphaproteobacteria bacterium]|jgi:O-succinylhomoserine sulfhydrylase|nr:O-succinylhomoserine sulfhydrylase [Alphaproteobacteria bacterium]
MDGHTDPELWQRGWRPETHLVRGGTERSHHGETSEALYLNSGFVYDSAELAEARFKGDADGFIYSRYGNPTVAMFEKRMALLEEAGACFATASGMSAVFAALAAQLKVGDHVVAARALFGSCHVILTEILPRFGVETTLVDGSDLAQWEAAVRPETAVVFFETPANPTLELIDIAAVAEIAHRAGAQVVVDNVFSTPLLQKPLKLGADIVVYSGTKHIDGQGRCLGGAVLSDRAFRDDVLEPFLRHTGPALSPFNAWVLLKGLETLSLRVERHCRSARTIADLLAAHPKVAQVLYPGRPEHPQFELAQKQMADGGSVVSFELTGGKAAAFRLLNALQLIDISNNLGDAKSLITHPATTTHRAMGPEGRARMGVTNGMVRVSVGLEDAGDLTNDLARGLSRA